MRATLATMIATLTLAPTIAAQEHGQHEAPAAADSARPGLQHAGMGMSTGPLGIGMERQGSGTSWLPDATSMYAVHSMAGRWELMLHGNAFIQYIDEASNRGDSQFGVVSWFMAMASRSVEGGRLGVRAMLSADPITVGKCGYPDLLATGEFCNGKPLHDRQHPHDFFMELAAHYQQQLGSDVAFELYGGPVGEPALGPVAYPHRISALPGPLATIGHHWQDATHISFGVATAGFYGRRWKVEGSLFNGREPDEERFDFDFARLDSYSGRVWFMPNERWALQASLGQLTEAEAPREAGEGRVDVKRATASLTYHQPQGDVGSWTNTLVWGQNRAHGLSTSAFLIETSVNLDERNIFFGRGELAQKSGEDLALEEEAPMLADEVFTVGKLSFGYVRQFGNRGALLPGIGAHVSVNFIPDDLDPFYGSRTPIGMAVFVSLRPRPTRMHKMAAADAMHDRPGMHMQPAAPGTRDTAAHAGHGMHEDTETAKARQTMEFITLLLSDPQIEARVRADPRLRRLWSDQEVQRCLETMRRLRAAGQPLPANCPATRPAGGKHPSH